MQINSKNKTFVIAEIGINHGGNLNTAKKLIDAAVRAGWMLQISNIYYRKKDKKIHQFLIF